MKTNLEKSTKRYASIKVLCNVGITLIGVMIGVLLYLQF